MHLAAVVVDCEALQSGWPQQPVNAWSSLAFVVVGALVGFGGGNRAARWVGAATGLVGFGSLLFHGGDAAFGGWLHDWSIVVLLLLLIPFAGAEVRVRPWPIVAALGGAGVLVWLVPASGAWVAGALALAVGVREIMEWPSRAARPMLAAVALAGSGAVLTIMGRTGGTWCAPESVLQPHGGWHILAASALAFYAAARGWLVWDPGTRETSHRLT